MVYYAWSTAYIIDQLEHNRCYVSETEWQRIHDEKPGATRIFANITCGNRILYCSLGEPIPRIEEELYVEGSTPVVVPDWIREVFYIEGAGEFVDIVWLSEESFSNATRVVLRSHDSVLHHTDLREELERAMTNHGVISEGVTIPILLRGLGNYSINIDVIRTEPTNVVLLEGDEIVFEFEEALDSVPVAPPPPPVATPPVATPPLAPAPERRGHSLGGTNHPPLPDGRPWNPWRV